MRLINFAHSEVFMLGTFGALIAATQILDVPNLINGKYPYKIGIALVLSLVLSVRVHRLRAAQRLLLGERGTRDLAGHAADIDREFRSLHSYVEDVAGRLQQRMETVAQGMRVLAEIVGS